MCMDVSIHMHSYTYMHPKDKWDSQTYAHTRV